MSLSAAADFVWEPKRALSLKAARKRSQLIAILRRVFVACAGASFASVFVFMALYAVEGGFEANQFAATEPLRMINPRFIGRTENGGPYQLTESGDRRACGRREPVHQAGETAGLPDETRNDHARHGGFMTSRKRPSFSRARSGTRTRAAIVLHPT